MVSRKQSQLNRLARNQAMARYRKQRQRNCLAGKGVFDFILVLDNLKAGFNVPKIFRSAEAMGAAAIHLINIGPFDPAPAKGAFKTVPARFFDEFGQSYAALIEQGYSVYTLEPGDQPPIYDVELEKKSAFVVGHEEMGISFNLDEYPDIRRLSIPQFGAVQSLNVSVAASIMMYEYVRQHVSPAK